MEIILSAISAGGLVGASNQYACLLVLSLAARLGVVQLNGPMQFMSSLWFMGLVALLWLVTIAPAFSSHLAPGVMHVINTAVHFISGFVVPVSSALMGLAAVGVIVNLNPDLKAALDTLQIFNGRSGVLGGNGVLIAGGSAVTAVALGGMKALAKPMISTGTGTAGTASAPAFALAENVAAVALMGLAYALGKVNPWWLVGLLGAVLVVSVGLLLFGLYQLWRLKKGLGRLLYILQVHPRAGLSICVEFFVWGLGWLVWKNVGRGAVSFLAWVVWLAIFLAIQPAVTVLFALLPPLIPIALLSANFFMLAIFVGIGLGTSSALMKTLEKEVPLGEAAHLALA